MTADTGTIHVSCPYCAARYLLPSHLMGPGGAKVRCPSCARTFSVPAPPGSGEPNIAAGGAGAAAASPGLRDPRQSSDRAPAMPPAAELTPLEQARELLGQLAEREGEDLQRAAAGGTLFAEYGPAIFSAYDEFRHSAAGKDPAPFREALRERWAIDLPEITPI